MLCHTFPQERPTGRSGTASAGSGKSADAEVPSFSRKISRRLGRFFTAGAGAILPTDRCFVHQTQGSPSSGGREPNLFRGTSEAGSNRTRMRCYTVRLACRKARPACVFNRRCSAAHGNSGDSLGICCNDQ